MSYNPFTSGENLNPDKLNSKLEQVNKLLSKAYVHNNELRKRIDVLTTAFALANTEIAGGTVDSSTAFHNLPVGASGQEINIGAKHFVADYANTNLAVISANQVTNDNYNLTLTNTNTISRLPLSPNEFGELYPSLGTELSCATVDIDNSMLWSILSPTMIWADSSSSSSILIEIEVPPTLTPLLNKVTINPIAGTTYKIQYDDFEGTSHYVDSNMAGSYFTGKKTFYLDGEKFAGKFKLYLTGTQVGGSYSYGLSHFTAVYNDYNSSGDTTIEISNMGASIDKNLTYLNANVADNVDITNEDITIAISSASGAGFDSNIIYDSTLHQYPLTTQSMSIVDGGSPTDKMYVKVTMKGRDNGTPSLQDLTIRYQEV